MMCVIVISFNGTVSLFYLVQVCIH